MDKLINALREILSGLGLDENQIDNVVAKLSAIANDEVVEENPTVEGDPSNQEPALENLPQPPLEDVIEEVSEEQTPDPIPDEVPPEQVVEEVQPTEDVVPPVEPPIPAQPPFDPSPLLAEIDELKKANEGLIARVESLEEALKVAGVIDGENPVTQVGDPLPSQSPQNPTDDVLGSVIQRLNSHKKF